MAINKLDEKKIILVTGGNGLLGHGLREMSTGTERRDSEEWHFIDIEDADLLDKEATFEVFNRIKPTHVIHLAAMVGGYYYMSRQNNDMFIQNIQMNNNVLETCHKLGVKKVVSTMTIAGFPHEAKLPLQENQFHDGLPTEDYLGYAMSKRMIDIFNRTYHRQYGVTYTSVIPTNMFGPFDQFHLEDGHVVANLIYKIFIAKETGCPLVLYGTGVASRQFLFSHDAARLVIWAIREYNDIEPLILTVAPSEEMTILELTKKLMKVMNFDGEIQFDPSQSDGRLRWSASNEKLLKLNPDFQFTPFETALKTTCDWFIANFDTLRK